MVGQQGFDGLGGLGGGQVLEEVVEIGPGLQGIGLGGFDEAVQQGAGLCAPSTSMGSGLLYFSQVSSTIEQGVSSYQKRFQATPQKGAS
jgi:hypothetical protein